MCTTDNWRAVCRQGTGPLASRFPGRNARHFATYPDVYRRPQGQANRHPDCVSLPLIFVGIVMAVALLRQLLADHG